ncbi:MAG: hypothetical protein ABIJ34_01695 [archaeon]
MKIQETTTYAITLSKKEFNDLKDYFTDIHHKQHYKEFDLPEPGKVSLLVDNNAFVHFFSEKLNSAVVYET